MVSRLIDRKVASAISSISTSTRCKAAADIGVLARLLGALAGRGLEQGDDVHEGDAAAIAGEAIAARRPAPAAHQPRA